MGYRIALAGNPNCGKTTLFNALTGSNQYVGNWPGVTVEKKEGKLKKYDNVVVADLPGIYSLSPYTVEEIVARDYLVNERPNVILNIVDGTNIERNLYLTTQLIELGIPVVVAINMMDVVEKNGDKIDFDGLSRRLGAEVVEISALKGTGINEAADIAVSVAKKGARPPKHIYTGEVEHALAHIEEACLHDIPAEQQRWCAVKIFERDEKVLDLLKLPKNVIDHIEDDIKLCEYQLDDESASIIINERYNYIESILDKVYTKAGAGKLTVSDKIDKIVTNRILGLPIFAGIMFVVYYVSMSTVGGWASAWVTDVLFGEYVPSIIASALEGRVADWLYGLIQDGIVAGVGSVLGFVPQMMVLFMFLAFLEGCGYMSRVAFVMDRIFRNFGLSGKSFIPMLIGTGCSVPGIMASRTIENERDRRMTVITTSFIPCSAKMPVIGLIAGACFGDNGLIATSAYFVGVMAVLVSGIILKKTKRFSGEASPFVMELPAYHMPTVDTVLRSMWERGWSFIKKACTVITLSAIVIWFLKSFTLSGGLRMTDDMDISILANIGKAFSWLFVPLGWGGWKTAVSTITGLIAKENVVSTFGVLYHFSSGELSENGMEIWSAFSQNLTELSGGHTALAGYSFLMFNLLCAPCFAAVSAIRKEMNSPKWTLFALGYQTAFAYSVSLLVFQLGCAFSGDVNMIGLIFALAVLGVLIYLLVRKNKYESKLTTQKNKEKVKG